MKKNSILLWAGLVLLVSCLAWMNFQAPRIALAQTPTPDPAITALQATVTDQQLEINKLKTDVEINKKSADAELRDIRWQLDQKLWLFGLFVAVVSFIGYNNYRSIDTKAREKVETALSQQLYRLDPSNLIIRVPQNVDMQKEWDRLSVAGFKNLRGYTRLDKGNYHGVTLVRLQTDVEIAEFVDFIKRNEANLDPQQAGFVLFTSKRLEDDVLNCFGNLGVANLSVQIVIAVMAVGRGITPLPPGAK